jgi:glycerate 2-kinase
MRLVSAGKAAWAMAHAVSAISHDTARGLIAGPRAGTKTGDTAFEWFDAGHPLPNDASASAGKRALELATTSALEDDAWLLVLLSGGASAMLVAPASGVTLDDKLATARVLMRAGLAIDELNCVRKHLSDIKGGRLARVARRTITLAISDVHAPVADDPSVIGSGPTVPDATTFADAVRIVRGVAGIPKRVVERLERGARGDEPETVKAGEEQISDAVYEIIGNRHTALAGAQARAEALGYAVAVVGGPVIGEARAASRAFVAAARKIAKGSARPLCVLGAGETTVTVKGTGLGGRSQELALAATPTIASLGRAALLASIGTDGIDGPTDAAGAIVDSTTLARAERAGVDWESMLASNDAYHFFEPLGDLVRWGPTGTNVGDVQVLLVA